MYANAAVTLCCMVDTMMQTYIQRKEEEFVKQGGIKERMTAARLGYRTSEREALAEARRQIAELQQQVAWLKNENAILRQQLDSRR